MSTRRMQSREGMPLGRARNPFEPLPAVGGPPVDGGRAIAPAHQAAHRDHHDVDEQVLAVAGVTGVGQGLEVGADRLRRSPTWRSCEASRRADRGLAG